MAFDCFKYPGKNGRKIVPNSGRVPQNSDQRLVVRYSDIPICDEIEDDQKSEEDVCSVSDQLGVLRLQAGKTAYFKLKRPRETVPQKDSKPKKPDNDKNTEVVMRFLKRQMVKVTKNLKDGQLSMMSKLLRFGSKN